MGKLTLVIILLSLVIICGGFTQANGVTNPVASIAHAIAPLG